MVAAGIIVDYLTPELADLCRVSAEHAGVNAIVIDATDGGTGNLGYAGGLNTGLRWLGEEGHHPDVLVCTNADVEYPGHADVARCLRLFDEHPRLAVLGPRQVTPDGRLVHAGVDRLGDTTGGRGFGERDRGQHREAYRVCRQVSGSVMFVRAAALRSIGGWFPAPDVLYYEDAALCLAVQDEGWDVAYTGAATFIHHVAASPEPPSGRAALARAARAAFQRIMREAV